jgi:hypothetical protein
MLFRIVFFGRDIHILCRLSGKIYVDRTSETEFARAKSYLCSTRSLLEKEAIGSSFVVQNIVNISKIKSSRAMDVMTYHVQI